MMLIKKAYEALEPGKFIMIYDFLLDENNPKKTADNFFMSLHMLTCGKGSQFTKEEISKYLSDAGFTNLEFT